MSKEPTRSASSATTPPSEMTATSVVPPPTSITMLPIGSWIGSPAPIAAAIGCSIRYGLRRARAPRGFEHGPLLDVRDGRRHADQHPRAIQAVDAGALEQQPDHALRDVEVGDRAAAQGPHRDDVAGRAADHLPRLLPHREHVLRAAVERDHRRLVEDDPPRSARTPACSPYRGRSRDRETGCGLTRRVGDDAPTARVRARAGRARTPRCCAPSSSAAGCAPR